METSVNNKCRAFTSLEQSKKLAEILPIESSDMYWWSSGKRYYIESIDDDDYEEDKDIRAWSLAALLGVLQYPALFQRTDQKWGCTVWVYTKQPYSILPKDSPIDACVAMIEHLHELKML